MPYHTLGVSEWVTKTKIRKKSRHQQTKGKNNLIDTNLGNRLNSLSAKHSNFSLSLSTDLCFHIFVFVYSLNEYKYLVAFGAHNTVVYLDIRRTLNRRAIYLKYFYFQKMSALIFYFVAVASSHFGYSLYLIHLLNNTKS